MLVRAPRFRGVLQLLNRQVTPFVTLRLAAVLVLVLAAAMLTAFAPVALKLMVDAFTGQGHSPEPALVLLVTLYVLSQWLARVANEVRGLLYRRIQRRLFRTLSERLFAHLMHLPLRFHLDRHTGGVSETLSNGLEGFQLVLQQLVLIALPVTAELGIVVVILGRMAPPLFLALFCGALIFYASAFAYSAVVLSDSARSASAARVDAGAAITDGLLNYETVKYFTAESLVQERVGTALARSEDEWLAFSRKYACSSLVVATIFAAFLAATTWYATIEVHNGHMTIGAFVLVNTYMLQLARPVEMLGNAMRSFSQGFAMLEKLQQLFSETTEPASIISAGGPRMASALEFDRVSLSYRKERRVLTDISFRISPKRTLGIVGSSGSGKSTIVRLLMRLIEPDRGKIFLDNIWISTLALSDVRSAIAVVPQDTVLFNETLAYNIAFGRAGAQLHEITQAARIARLHEFIMTLPDGYNTKVGERGVKLSGGERQRVSIARAVLKSPRIYIFDEATSSLDSKTEQEILDSLREIAKHSSTLVIAHRLSTVVHADEILVLEDGCITERGTHPCLLGHDGRYAALWRAQHPGPAAA